jgi:hypothetical protein
MPVKNPSAHVHARRSQSVWVVADCACPRVVGLHRWRRSWWSIIRRSSFTTLRRASRRFRSPLRRVNLCSSSRRLISWRHWRIRVVHRRGHVLQAVLLALWICVVIDRGILVVRVISCSLLSVQKPLRIISYCYKSVLCQGVCMTYSVVCKRTKSFVNPSFCVPVSDCHVRHEEEEYSKENRPSNNLSCLQRHQ